jgi:hypothetical protein
VRQCCQDWLDGRLPGRDPKTVAKNKFVLEPVLAVIGHIRLRDLAVTTWTGHWPRSPPRAAAPRWRWLTWH